MRLIDADALIEESLQEGAYGYVDTYQIANAPTIDPVVHGEWIHIPQIEWGDTWVCSICGEKTTSSFMEEPRYKYCPMCGARMKGNNDETD